MPMNEYRTRPRPCWCTGYWFPHRTGGGACEHSKSRNVHLARRSGDPELILTAWLEFVFDNPGKPVSGIEPPF